MNFGLVDGIIFSKGGNTMPFKIKNCQICAEEFQPRSGVAKVCDTCRPEWERRKKQERHKKTYIRKGYNQKKENNNSWRGGIGVFVEMAYNDYSLEKKCNRCGSESFLCVHHKDRNRRNNAKENLEILCKSCHQKEHVKRNEKGQFTKQHFKG